MKTNNDQPDTVSVHKKAEPQACKRCGHPITELTGEPYGGENRGRGSKLRKYCRKCMNLLRYERAQERKLLRQLPEEMLSEEDRARIGLWVPPEKGAVPPMTWVEYEAMQGLELEEFLEDLKDFED